MVVIAHTETNEPDDSRASKLKDQFLLEYEFINLPNRAKKRLKKDLLFSIGYDPKVPITKQQLNIRMIYYMRKDDMGKSNQVLEYFQQHRHRYKRKAPAQ